MAGSFDRGPTNFGGQVRTILPHREEPGLPFNEGVQAPSVYVGFTLVRVRQEAWRGEKATETRIHPWAPFPAWAGAESNSWIGLSNSNKLAGEHNSQFATATACHEAFSDPMSGSIPERPGRPGPEPHDEMGRTAHEGEEINGRAVGTERGPA